MAKCPLFGSNFVLKDASLNFASVRCPEERGGRFSEVSFTLAKINRCFCVCPFKGGCPLLGGSVKTGSTVSVTVLNPVINQSIKFLFLCHLHTQPARKGL